MKTHKLFFFPLFFFFSVYRFNFSFPSFMQQSQKVVHKNSFIHTVSTTSATAKSRKSERNCCKIKRICLETLILIFHFWVLFISLKRSAHNSLIYSSTCTINLHCSFMFDIIICSLFIFFLSFSFSHKITLMTIVRSVVGSRPTVFT